MYGLPCRTHAREQATQMRQGGGILRRQWRIGRTERGAGVSAGASATRRAGTCGGSSPRVHPRQSRRWLTMLDAVKASPVILLWHSSYTLLSLCVNASAFWYGAVGSTSLKHGVVRPEKLREASLWNEESPGGPHFCRLRKPPVIMACWEESCEILKPSHWVQAQWRRQGGAQRRIHPMMMP